MTPREVREFVATLTHPKPCVMEFKRRAVKLHCMREELAPALARDILQLLIVRGALLKSSNMAFCGLDDTIDMISRQQSESVVYTALFEDVDDVFSVYVTDCPDREIQCLRMKRQATTQPELKRLIGQRIAAASDDGTTAVLRVGKRELGVDSARLQVSTPGVQISELVGRTITNVRVHPFGVSLSFDLDLTVDFEEGNLRCSDQVLRVPDPAMYGELVEGY